MNFIGYVKKFGHLSFKERPFNDVDAGILATAVYTNLEVVAPSIFDSKGKPTLFKNIFAVDLPVVTAGKTFLKGNDKLLPLLRESKRFGEVGIRYVHKVYNEDLANQFYAATFIVPNVGTFIAFRGTDVSTIGWQEDLNLAIKDVVISQLDAFDYLRIVAGLTKGPLYMAGHSKGGNLALFSAINCAKDIQDRLVNIYLFDSNGLKDESYYELDKYNAIKDRIRFFCPKNTIVGTIMNNPDKKIILRSTSFFIFQHNPITWQVDANTGDFVHLPRLTKAAETRFIFFKEFINSIDNKDKSLFISLFVKLVGGSRSLLSDFISSFGKPFRIAKMWRGLNNEDRASVKKAVKAFKTCRKTAKDKRKGYSSSKKS